MRSSRRSTRRTAAALAATIAAAGIAAAISAPANAADVTATFQITGGGGLAISVPSGVVNLGSEPPGSAALSGQLGPVTVTDSRGALSAVWTATVSSTEFVTGTGAAANQKVAKSAIAYSSGVGTAAADQDGAFVPSVGASLIIPATAGTWAGTGNNTVTWNPTLVFALAPSQVAGTYAGTVTHSVL